MERIDSWDEYFFRLAHLAARKSKDPSTKVGCVIVNDDKVVLSTGFNGFPRGVNEKILSRWERPEKYEWVEHAERNAINNAARVGSALKGGIVYTTLPPCTGCMKGLIQVGVKEIVVLADAGHGVGGGTHYDITIGDVMQDEVKLPLRVVTKTWEW